MPYENIMHNYNVCDADVAMWLCADVVISLCADVIIWLCADGYVG